MRLHRTAGLLSLASAAALVAMSGQALADPPDPNPGPSPRHVETQFSPQEISIMAQKAGRTESEQVAHLESQQDQNNTYAELASKGYQFQGAYFDAHNTLVVQAKDGSPAARAAEKAGLDVQAPQYGEDRLGQIAAEISDATAQEPSVATISPDVAADRVVVTVSGDTAAAQKLLAPYGDAVQIRAGEANSMHAGVLGGDALYLDGSARCSAGFPAHDDDGTRVMVWVGHCLEGVSTISNADGERIGTTGDTKFVSYDGQDDRDMGYVILDDGDTMSSDVNDYDSGEKLDADQGVWRAPVGTDTCKSGSTTGITCGKITSYDNTVTYSDSSGRTQARVTGLGAASICTEGGDSGGAYVSGGYAVGMTSGGPSNQDCGGMNSEDASGSSYFQPVDDALSTFGLTYGD